MYEGYADPYSNNLMEAEKEMLLSVKNIVGNAKHMKSVMEPTRQHLIILENGL